MSRRIMVVLIAVFVLVAMVVAMSPGFAQIEVKAPVDPKLDKLDKLDKVEKGKAFAKSGPIEAKK